jgi:hypothetical protein
MSTHSNASLWPVFLPACLAMIAKSYMYCNDSFGSAGATLTGTSISGEQSGGEKICFVSPLQQPGFCQMHDEGVVTPSWVNFSFVVEGCIMQELFVHDL